MPRTPWRPLLFVVLLVLSALAVPGAAQAAATVHGLKGEYFRMSAPGARDFAQLGGVVLDPNIDLPGLVGTFGSLTGITEHTTARWTGKITAPATGDYTFSMIGDNGFRFLIDEQPVIDHWVGDWDVEQTSAPVHLVAGEARELAGRFLPAEVHYPQLARWLRRMEALPGYEATLPPGWQKL